MRTPLPMTAGRRIALIVGVPLALVMIGWTALTAVALAGTGTYRINLDIPVHGRTVTLAVDSGDVRVSPHVGDRIRLTGTATWALVRSRLTWQRTPSGVAVHPHCRQITGSCSFNFTVAMPGGLATVISSASGDLSATGLTAPVRLRADSGDIRVSALSEGVRINDQSGEITGASLAGQVFIQNQSGDINVTGLASQDVTAQDRSGNITLTFATVPARVQVSNESGDIRLVLPHGSTEYQVTASTRSGSTIVTVPRSTSSRHLITVTNQSGDITISN
jgi:putative adhesin